MGATTVTKEITKIVSKLHVLLFVLVSLPIVQVVQSNEWTKDMVGKMSVIKRRHGWHAKKMNRWRSTHKLSATFSVSCLQVHP